MGTRAAMAQPDRPKQRWSLDFMPGAFTNGHLFRTSLWSITLCANACSRRAPDRLVIHSISSQQSTKGRTLWSDKNRAPGQSTGAKHEMLGPTVFVAEQQPSLKMLVIAGIYCWNKGANRSQWCVLPSEKRDCTSMKCQFLRQRVRPKKEEKR